MAYTSTDLTTIESAIIELAAGRRNVQVTLNGKSIRYAETDLPALRKLRDEIRAELNAAAGQKRFFRTSTSKGL